MGSWLALAEPGVTLGTSCFCLAWPLQPPREVQQAPEALPDCGLCVGLYTPFPVSQAGNQGAGGGLSCSHRGAQLGVDAGTRWVGDVVEGGSQARPIYVPGTPRKRLTEKWAMPSGHFCFPLLSLGLLPF